ncbi:MULTISPECIES: LysE family translocator [Shewanella]|jgi:threonine/homoserine/homoserine lactone efflux protein|uniref:Lysine exporter protein (LYSE/YGGA) n=2 Tax=Shewanella putrefaciens TaxID=24 RepID=A4Y1M2_SHEPC|nr:MULTISPECIES: LysE family translocator [Shewanella]CAD6365936.1 Homoserine/homoserine lactone efflux protein [Shewanella hafniensis]MCA1896926.1 LysE family translocator [Shewanella putrefaciens]MCK7631024.1 LysE family translocator [Shewanella sp. JNE9-1]MCK7634008.1 LysE family translocator [Shewanella sp. JNE17]MCK7646277.1 LysE family translocator [Shewanella sp. JNE3-1]
MHPDTWLLYLFAIVLIGISPGPIAMLSMSHGIHFGKIRSIATGLGSVSAALILMMASAAGLGAVISASDYGFTLLKWCGAAYLVFLGIKLLLTKSHAAPIEVSQLKGKGTPKQLYKQAFLVGISNPKDLLFFAALFPQFIDISAPQVPQLTLLALTWAVVDFGFVMIYASMANVLAPTLRASNKLHWFDRTSGGVFLTLAVILISRD